jgi:hypothetical protein
LLRAEEPSTESDRYPVNYAPQGETMIANFRNRLKRQEGKAGWILLWLLGVPIPVLLVLFLLRGCT